MQKPSDTVNKLNYMRNFIFNDLPLFVVNNTSLSKDVRILLFLKPGT